MAERLDQRKVLSRIGAPACFRLTINGLGFRAGAGLCGKGSVMAEARSPVADPDSLSRLVSDAAVGRWLSAVGYASEDLSVVEMVARQFE